MKIGTFATILTLVTILVCSSQCEGQQSEKNAKRPDITQFLSFENLNAGNAGLHQIVSDKYVRRELELTDRQIQKIDELGSGLNDRYVKLKPPTDVEFGFVRDKNGKEKWLPIDQTPQFKTFRLKQKDMLKKHFESVVEVLLPHQKRRLSQIIAQTILHRTRAPFGAYTNPDLQNFIELTSEEQKKLNSTAKIEYANYLKEIDDLKRKYDTKMRSVLPKSKQRKVDELMGEPYLWIHRLVPNRANGRSPKFQRR
jgi:hypothetical protein